MKPGSPARLRAGTARPARRRTRAPLAARLTAGLAGVLPGVLALAVLAGCEQLGTLGSKEGRGGLPVRQAAEISLVVSQTRSQFPDLSGMSIPFQARKAPEDDTAEPELSLRGTGVSVEQGLQMQQRERITVAVHLTKPRYTRGYLELTRDGTAADRWAIVAFDLNGDPRKTFDFSYVLATPGGELRYLVLIGGAFKAEGAEQVGYEGTLVIPGAGNDIAHWQRAYKLDFGYRYPVVPPHEPQVKEAVSLFRDLERDAAGLQRLRERIAAAEGDLATLRNTPVPAEQQAKHDAALAKAEERLRTAKAEHRALVDVTGARLVQYYHLRQAIAEAYAVFITTNRYLWLDRDGRQGFYDDWKRVEYHHPRIDEIVSAYTTHTEQPGPVLEARTAAMEVIRRRDNWSTDPSRPATASAKPEKAAPSGAEVSIKPK